MRGADPKRRGRSPALAVALAVAFAVAASRAPAQQAPEVEPTPQVTPPPLEPRPAPESAEPVVPAGTTTDDLLGIPVSGTFSLRYLLRTTSDDADNDLYGFLGLDLGDPDRHLVTGHVLTKAAWDVDGDIHHRNATSFPSLEDTYDSRLTGQLYEAYAAYHGFDSIEIARLGRQILDETPVQTYLDGARADTRPSGPLAWRFGAYAGTPSHLYESSPEGDLLFGAFGEARPFRSTRTRLDWMQVQDDYLDSERHNALVQLAVWQQLGESLAMHGRYSTLDWEGRDLELRGDWMQQDGDAQVELGYYQLLTRQSAQAIEFDPFFEMAGDYEPYRELRANASKGFGDHWNIAVGADVRRLVDSSDEGTYNHDYERWYVQPSLLEWPDEATTITAAAEWWDDGDEVTRTFDGTIEHEFTEATKGHLGTTYSLYKYDYLTQSERDHVRTYFVGVETRATKSLRLRLDYAYEIDAFDRYNTLRAAATWTF